MTKPERSDQMGILGRMAAGASDRVLDIVDPNQVLDYVDINALLGRVDVDELLDRVDVNALLDRVDVDRLLDRVDADALMARVDIDALMDRVDVESIVQRAGIPEIVAESTGHLTGSALDLVRKPIVGLDEILFRFLNRIVGRDPDEMPRGPSELVDWADDHGLKEEGLKTGRYAGPLTRLLAVVADGFFVTTGFTVLLAGITFLIQLIAPEFELPEGRPLVFGIAFYIWAFLYLLFSLAIFGKTIGKALLGVRVVGSDGSLTLRSGKPFMRTLTYPLSFVILGLGLLGVVWGRERRAWHDHFAGTAVVYDWGSRTAALPSPLARYLERKQAEEEE